MPAKEGDAAFERRVQLARLLSDRAQIDADNKPPLFASLGDFTYPITTKEAPAQSYFDQGLRLMHAFNHPEALRAFRWAQQIDPACAMCSWGEAYVLGPNINAPMDPEAIAPAAAAISRAKERGGYRKRTRANADHGSRKALLRGSSGGPVGAQSGVRGRHGGRRRAVSRRRRDHYPLCRCAHEPVAVGLLGSGRTHSEAAGRTPGSDA